MPESKDPRQRFMIKLPPDLHRELMAYAGIRGEALSDLIVRVMASWWEAQPERAEISTLTRKMAPVPPPPPPESAAAPKTPEKKSPREKRQGS
jgi:hypothetical protein